MEWLGIPRRSEPDIGPFYQPYRNLVKTMADIPKPRLQVALPYELFGQFKEAIKKRYGDFSAFNVEKATLEAVETWVRQNQQ